MLIQFIMHNFSEWFSLKPSYQTKHGIPSMYWYSFSPTMHPQSPFATANVTSACNSRDMHLFCIYPCSRHYLIQYCLCLQQTFPYMTFTSASDIHLYCMYFCSRCTIILYLSLYKICTYIVFIPGADMK